MELSIRIGELGRPVHVSIGRARLGWSILLGGLVAVGFLFAGWQVLSSAKIYPQLLYHSRKAVSDRGALERMRKEEVDLSRQVNAFDSLRTRLDGRFGIPVPVAASGEGGVSDDRLLEELFPDPRGEEAWARSVEDMGTRASQSRQAISQGLQTARLRLAKMEQTPSVAPARGPYSSGFGWRLHPILGVYQMHEGQDITGSVGTPVMATASGKVVEAEYSSSYGNYVVLAHEGGIRTLYAHLSAFRCQVGRSVRRGEVIGLLGNTGRSTGPHVHYEVHVGGRPVDPLRWILPPLQVP